jgi:hypothetical protein
MYLQGLLTLTGAAQKLSTATGIAEAFGVATNGALGNIACREIHLQPAGGNATAVRFGDKNLTSLLYAFQLPAGDTGDPPPPMVMGPYGGDPIRLSEIYALGTEGEIVHIGMVI